MQQFTTQQIEEAIQQLGINFEEEGFDREEFELGMNVELPEHGSEDEELNITNDDPVIIGKMVLAHVRAVPDFYTRLQELMATAEEDSQIE